MPHPNPWRRLNELAHVTLVWHDHGHLGLTRHSTQTISLRRDLDQAARRCTLMHELLHVENGPQLSTLAAKEERAVQRATARIMLPDIRAVGEALAWAHLDLEAAAAELWVDARTLRDRLRWLHPSERHYLQRRLEDVEVF